MAKKILSLLLALVLALGALPLGVSAEKTDVDAIAGELASEYNRALYRSGRYTLSGYCGLMTSYQLYLQKHLRKALQ